MNRSIVWVLLLCWLSAAWSDDAALMFQKKREAIRTMQATFSQVIYAKEREISRSTGEMALLKPGYFRWQTLQPTSQLIVADGARLWVYDIDLEQVTVKKQTQDTESGVSLFLSDDAINLSNSFDISYKKIGHQREFDLRAKSRQADFKHVMFRFDGERLQGMVFIDALGQRTTVQFQKIKMNHLLSTKMFRFTPPKGVDVLDEGGVRG